MNHLNINQQPKPNASSASINPYLSNMKPASFNATHQTNQINFTNFPNTSNGSILPNIGNTLSTDLWQ